MRTMLVPERALATSVDPELTPVLVMLVSPTAMWELRPSKTWSELEPWVMSASAMVIEFLAEELEHVLLNESMVASCISMAQPQPAMVKLSMSKFVISTTSLTMEEPLIETSSAVMSAKVPGWIRCMVMSPAVMVSKTASEPDGPLPVCDQPPGISHKSADPKSTSVMLMLPMALMPELA